MSDSKRNELTAEYNKAESALCVSAIQWSQMVASGRPDDVAMAKLFDAANAYNSASFALATFEMNSAPVIRA